MKQSEALLQQLLSIYNYLHEHPEVSWQEHETTDYLVHFLERLGLSPVRLKGCTGLYVDIGQGIPRVGLRADMDALWQEVDGVMCANHSCGHDGHMTMALGAILLLKDQVQLGSAVRIIFQPAEEKGGGALKVIEQGIVDSLHYLFSVHVRPVQEVQDGFYAPALFHGASRSFVGEIVGEDAHAARPHLGNNAIEVGGAIIQELSLIHHDPMVPASYKVTSFHAGGDATNIIPGKATFAIDVRAQRNDVMESITEQILKRIEHIALLHEVKIHLTEKVNLVAAEVHPEAERILAQAICDEVGPQSLHAAVHTPGGEDFHYYAVKCPNLKASMLGLGCGLFPGLHHPDMTFNVKRLMTGAQILARAVNLALQKVTTGEDEKYVRISDNQRTNYN